MALKLTRTDSTRSSLGPGGQEGACRARASRRVSDQDDRYRAEPTASLFSLRPLSPHCSGQCAKGTLLLPERHSETRLYCLCKIAIPNRNSKILPPTPITHSVSPPRLMTAEGAGRILTTVPPSHGQREKASNRLFSLSRSLACSGECSCAPAFPKGLWSWHPCFLYFPPSDQGRRISLALRFPFTVRNCND